MRNKIRLLVALLTTMVFAGVINLCFATTTGVPYTLHLINKSDYTIRIMHLSENIPGSYCIDYSTLPTVPAGKQASITLEEKLGCRHYTLHHEKKFIIFTVYATTKAEAEAAKLTEKEIIENGKKIGTLFFGFKTFMKEGLHKNAPGGQEGYSPIINQLAEAPVNMSRTAVGFENATLTFKNSAHQ